MPSLPRPSTSRKAAAGRAVDDERAMPFNGAAHMSFTFNARGAPRQQVTTEQGMSRGRNGRTLTPSVSCQSTGGSSFT
jgi:hypothetical protein